LWEIERSLADVGCTLAEIVALAKRSVWNKYEGRADEFKRLILEATKALAQKSSTQTDKDDLLREDTKQANLEWFDDILANVKPPTWLVDYIITEGGVGFIGGQPKSFKSWFGLDLIISVASGAKFLNYFKVNNPGPVLYLQEEDPGTTVKKRWKKVIEAKSTDYLALEHDEVMWYPSSALPVRLPILGKLQAGLILSEGVWQEWLDDKLASGVLMPDGSTEAYRLVLIDTMMMTVGALEENRSQEMMTKFFKPLKQLARKHECALILVHHLNKGDSDKRPGQRLLGSVANHAWSEDSIYLETKGKNIELITESKSWQSKRYLVSGVNNAIGWRPVMSHTKTDAIQTTKQWQSSDPILTALRDLGDMATAKVIAEHTNLHINTVRNKCRNLERQDLIIRYGINWKLR